MYKYDMIMEDAVNIRTRVKKRWMVRDMMGKRNCGQNSERDEMSMCLNNMKRVRKRFSCLWVNTHE